MLPNDALNAVRSATSASPRSWVTGWWPPTSVDPSPFHSRSAISRRSAMPRRLAQSAPWRSRASARVRSRSTTTSRRTTPATGGWPTRRATRTRSGGRWRSCSQDVADEFGEAKLFRPNRDTRFSKDKSPYKTNIAAVIYQRRGGSVYVSLAAEGLHVGGGVYHLERPQLARLREAIDDDRTGKEIERHRRRPAQGQGRRHRPRRREDRAARLLARPPPHRPAPPRRPRRHVRPQARRLAPHRRRPRTASSTAGTSSSPSTTGSRSTLTTSVRVSAAYGAEPAQTLGSTSGRGRGWLGGCRCRRGGGRGRGW